MSRISKSKETKSRLISVRGWGEGGMGTDCSWIWGFFGGDGDVLELGGGDGCTTS